MVRARYDGEQFERCGHDCCRQSFFLCCSLSQHSLRECSSLSHIGSRMTAVLVRGSRQRFSTSANPNFNPTRATYFLLASDPSFPRLFPFLLQFDLWKNFFAALSARHFPFLLEFDLWTAYFVEPPRAFFSSGTTALPFRTISTQFDLRETSVKTFMFPLTVYYC